MRQPGQRCHALGEVCLAGGGRAADHDHGPPPRAPREPPRELGEASCLSEQPGTVGRRELAGPKARDLRADPCAVAGVEEEQRSSAVVAARRLVLGDQRSGEVISARRDQVHHEERQVRGHVDAAQSGIEFHGVEDLDRVPLEDHVFRSQVAVAVTDEAARGPVLDLLVASVQERDRKAVRRCELPRTEGV
jgi:hypothetical protein